MGSISEKENFIKLVQARKMLDEEQLRECIAAWEKVSIQGGDRKIWDIACDLGYLTKKQHGRIDGHMAFISLREQDKKLGTAAVNHGLIDLNDCEIGLGIQRKTHKERGEIRRLADILLDMGVLKPEHADAFRKGNPVGELETQLPEAMARPARAPALKPDVSSESEIETGIDDGKTILTVKNNPEPEKEDEGEDTLPPRGRDISNDDTWV